MNELTNIDNLILLAILGGTIANLKNIAAWIWRIFSSRLFSSIEVSNNTRTYTLLLKWMNDKYAHKVTNFAYVTESNKAPEPPGGGHGTTEGGLYLGMGEFVFFYEGYPIWVSHDKKEITGTHELRTYQTIKIRSFRFAKKKLISILAQAESAAHTEKGVRICTQGYDSWQYRGTRQPRDFTNVILPKEAEESIVSAVRHFADHRETYIKSGIPHRLSILLHGLPGTGKSSTVVAIASMLDYTVHYLSLSGIDDSRLQCLLGAIPTKSILLIEDIDAQLESLDTEYSKINLSTVLNSFDGVLAPDGIITIVTTNYKDKIDERVLRPGRINLEVEFGPLTEDQRTRLAALRGIDTDSFVTASESMLITK